MINYTNPETDYAMEEKDVNECLSKLVIFCEMNRHSDQASKLKNKLIAMEEAVNSGRFKN